MLESLLPQVDEIRLFLNGFREPPECAFNNERIKFEISTDNLGAEQKLRWAGDWEGIYLSVDDDIVYPRNYAQKMVETIERWDGQALVTSHGRVYLDKPDTVHRTVQGSVGLYNKAVPAGRWINHGGTGVMAWDASKLRVPSVLPERNMVDMQIAIWAQLNSVPMWLVEHSGDWFTPLAALDPKGLFRASQHENHVRRNLLLRRHGESHGWKLLTLPA